MNEIKSTLMLTVRNLNTQKQEDVALHDELKEGQCHSYNFISTQTPHTPIANK